MQLPEYITKDEVRRVCSALGLRDWTALGQPDVTLDEAQCLLSEMDGTDMDIDPTVFREGLEVELEHGTRFPEANVTNNHPVITGRIVIAHLKESMDYYRRLAIAEAEGDLVAAILEGNKERAIRKLKAVEEGKLELAKTILGK